MSFTMQRACLKSRTVDQKDITFGSISSGFLLVAVRIYSPCVVFELLTYLSRLCEPEHYGNNEDFRENFTQDETPLSRPPGAIMLIPIDC